MCYQNVIRMLLDVIICYWMLLDGFSSGCVGRGSLFIPELLAVFRELSVDRASQVSPMLEVLVTLMHTLLRTSEA